MHSEREFAYESSSIRSTTIFRFGHITQKIDSRYTVVRSCSRNRNLFNIDTHTHTGTATIILVKRAWRPLRKVRTARSISSRFEASTVQMRLDESVPLQTFKTYEPMILPRPMYVSMNLQRRRFFIMLIRKHPKFIKCGMTTRSRHH